ncbi:hypothetical protein V6478_000593 [Providencia rettgeri]|nr:hypothetical protein [Providencia rettgeri]ELR5064524.1 hypothetical protein [Providencia rettgeri]ELR5163401.1 hypothetical protein [Providencia rettgeri]
MRERLIAVLGSLLVVSVMFLLGLKMIKIGLFENIETGTILAIPALFIAIGGLVSAFSAYNTSREHKNAILESNSISELIRSKNKLYKNLDGIITDKEKKELVDELSVRIKKEATNDIINEIKGSLVKDSKLIDIIKFFNESTVRMSRHIQKLNNLSILNLTFGIVISGFSIGILLLSIVDFSNSKNSIQDTVFYLVARMGVGVAVQLLALFFLNLYKKNIHEMKYIHNEITNIEAKKTAIMISHDFSEENKLAIVNNLLATERNFILDKGQTTVILEQNKIESSESKDLIGIIEVLLKKDKK